ncbi:DUF2975 domain-containing protein [Deinococcus sp. UYEF24]
MQKVRSVAARPSSQSILRLLKILLYIAAATESVLIIMLILSTGMDVVFPVLRSLVLPSLYPFLLSVGLKSIARLTMYFILISMITDVSLGKAFATKNVSRLRVLGSGFLLYAAYKVLALIVENSRNHSFSEISSLLLTSDVDTVLMIALGLFALAEVFKHGLVLRQEQDLTV